MTNTYDKGDLLNLSAIFKVNGVLTNPSHVWLLIQYPTGSELVIPKASLTNNTTGTFSYNIYLDDNGVWYYKFFGSGTVIAAEEAMFTVRSSEF